MVTLEISSTDIKIIEVTGGTVVKWASYSLEPDIFEEEAVTNSQALGAVIKHVMASSGIREKNVIVSVSSLYSLSRIVTVPTPLEQSVTEQAVLEAIEEVMPLSEEEMYFSWHSIGPGEGGQQVLVTGVPKDILDSEMQTLKTIGITPAILDLKTLALARAVNREQALILNVDDASLDTILIINGIPEVLRTIAWQPKDLPTEDRTEHLISALDLSVNYFNSQHPDFPIDPSTPLFITGKLSGDLTLMEQLRDGIGYTVEPFAPPLEYPDHMPVSQFAVNIGLALKATPSSRLNLGFSLKRKEITKSTGPNISTIPDINLLPRIYKPWRPSIKQMYSFLAMLGILGLIFPLYQVTTEAMGKTTRLNIRYTAINNLLEMRKSELGNREPLQKAINEYKSIINMGGGIIEDLDVIRNLAEELGITLTSISHGGNNISFTCQAPDYLVFRNYLTALEDSGRFSSVTRPSDLFPYPTGGAITIKLSPKSGG